MATAGMEMEAVKRELERRPRLDFSPEQVEVIRRTVAKDANDDELQLFLAYCKHSGLDPFTRQIYFMKIDDKPTFMASIDGLRIVAERSGKYGGQVGPFWCGKDGQWKDVWLSSDTPSASRVGIIRNDFREPLWAVARFESYVLKAFDGKPRKMWAKMPDLMIAKAAEALALRKAFPNDLSGIYVQEEMAQADTENEVTAEKAPKAAPAEKASGKGKAARAEAPAEAKAEKPAAKKEEPKPEPAKPEPVAVKAEVRQPEPKPKTTPRREQIAEIIQKAEVTNPQLGFHLCRMLGFEPSRAEEIGPFLSGTLCPEDRTAMEFQEAEGVWKCKKCNHRHMKSPAHDKQVDAVLAATLRFVSLHPKEEARPVILNEGKQELYDELLKYFAEASAG